ncbi:MAG: hypothetical protein WC700_18545 [Gemmatimonadaceae bacterium]|jgi:hypothetical protein
MTPQTPTLILFDAGTGADAREARGLALLARANGDRVVLRATSANGRTGGPWVRSVREALGPFTRWDLAPNGDLTITWEDKTP